MVEITSEDQNKVERMKRAEDSLRDLWGHIKCTNIRIIGIPEEEEEKKKKKGYEKVFEEIMVENFPNMEKHFISPSVLNEILAGYTNLACRFSPFSTLNISCHSLLACRVSAERSAVKHMGFLLYVACFFSLAAFNILSLCLVFVSLISMCLGMFLLGFILYDSL